MCLSSLLKPPNNGAKCIPVRDKGFLVQVNTLCIHPTQPFSLSHNGQLIITNPLNRGCIIYITLPGPGSNELALAKLSRQLIPGLFIAPGALILTHFVSSSLQTMEYAQQRIPVLNEFCVVCDEPHVFQNGPMLRVSAQSLAQLCQLIPRKHLNNTLRQGSPTFFV